VIYADGKMRLKKSFSLVIQRPIDSRDVQFWWKH